MKKVVILQSNYIPWKGYFDIIHDADLFVFYDDVQYTKNDWRNRNRIRTPDGTKWLTIDIESHLTQLICEVKFKIKRWNIKQWETIKQFYGKTPFFKQYRPFFEELYLVKDYESLSDFNQYTIQQIAGEILGIKTKFSDSRIYEKNKKRTDRLIDILMQTGASAYISGPIAKNYIEKDKFIDAGISLIYKDYTGYPEYPQPYEGFDHYVTILDLIFNVGTDAPWYIWGWRERGMD